MIYQPSPIDELDYMRLFYLACDAQDEDDATQERIDKDYAYGR